MFFKQRFYSIFFFVILFGISCISAPEVDGHAPPPSPPTDVPRPTTRSGDQAGLDTQIAQYSFEGSLNDGINRHHGTALKDGEPSNASYTPFQSGTGLALDPTQGLMLPQSLSQSIDASKGFELSLEFQITDLGSGEGEMLLFSTTPEPGYDANGMLIGIRHDPFAEADEYMVLFSYADGGYYFSDDHPGHQETVIGNFRTEDVINLKLSVDFETMSWSTLLNETYTGATFETNYDYNAIKANLRTNNWYFGWTEQQEIDMELDPSFYSTSTMIDNLEIWSPRRVGDLASFQQALAGLTDHVDGSNLLSEDQLAGYLTDIYINYPGNFAKAESEIFAFVEAYEANYPPLFADRQTVALSDMPMESQALIYIQQSIFDQEFVDGKMEKMAGIPYEFASIFPGAVSDLAEIEFDVPVPINGSYNRIKGAAVVGDLFDAKRPTGFYAKPGELVTIEIPSELTSAGLKVMVGAHDNDQSGLSETNRFVRISKTVPLDDEITTVVNPFGGGIYIKVPEGSNLGWVDIMISGAVKSGYFSTRAGVPADLADWQITLENQYVPWIDLESDKYMVTLPTGHLRDIRLTDPTELMGVWDEMMDGFRYVGGQPLERARPEYFILDSRLPDDAFGTGYPQVIGDENAPYAPFEEGVYQYVPTYVLQPEFWKSEYNTTLHERGHAAFHPTIVEETESQIHLNATYIYSEQFGTTLDDAFKYSSHELLTLDGAAMDWMITHNFRNNVDMSCDPTMDELVCDEIRYQHRGHAKYVVMADLFGWETVYKMNKVFYDAWSGSEDQELWVTNETVLRAASEANGVNMAPLFHFWGHTPSPELAEDLAELPASPEIYNQLLAYLELVPESQAVFQPWYEILLEAKGETHADRIDASFEAYDAEDYPQQMRDQICFLLGEYFPDELVTECDEVDYQPSRIWMPYLIHGTKFFQH